MTWSTGAIESVLALKRLGLSDARVSQFHISVARAESVALLDSYVGEKY